MSRITMLGRMSLLAAAVACASGCYRQARVSVVTQAPRALVAGTGRVVIEPLRWQGALVDGVPEATWIATHSRREQGHWLRARALLETRYREGLSAALAARGYRVVAQAEKGTVVVWPTVEEVVPGFWAFVGSDAEARLRVDLTDEDGDPLDTIEVQDRVKADLWSASSESRARKLAGAMADVTVKYLDGRLHGRAIARRGE